MLTNHGGAKLNFLPSPPQAYFKSRDHTATRQITRSRKKKYDISDDGYVVGSKVQQPAGSLEDYLYKLSDWARLHSRLPILLRRIMGWEKQER